jgi:hypothetical protein
MSGILSIDTICESCFVEENLFVDRDLASNWDHRWECDHCGEASVKRVMSAPMVLRASYHDGYKRGGDYQMLKEVAKLKKQAANVGGSAKKELEQAAAQIKRQAKQTKGKSE